MDLEAFDAWLHRRGRSRSADQYCKVVRRWLEDPDEIEFMMTARRLSPNYRRHLVACIRVWAKFVDDDELRKRLDDIKLPAPMPRDAREPFDFSEWFEIRNEIDRADYLSDPKRYVCALIALRGIRCGDVLRLTKRDVSRAVDTGTLSFEGKGERRQTYNAEPLKEHLEGLLECRWSGKRVCNLVCPLSALENAQATAGRQIRKAFDLVAESLEMKPEDLYAHRFRHTYATYFLQEMAGDPEAIFMLQQQMGWANLNTAVSYLRRSRRSELDAVESRMLSGERKNSNGKI